MAAQHEQERLQEAWNKRDHATEARKLSKLFIDNKIATFMNEWQIDAGVVE